MKVLLLFTKIKRQNLLEIFNKENGLSFNSSDGERKRVKPDKLLK